jgi:cytochrome c-type biogenesis protein CcmH
MTSLFWIWVAGMLVLAVGLVVRPLYKGGTDSVISGQQRNLGLLQQQLAEYQQQVTDGLLSHSDFELHKQELLQRLSIESMGAENQTLVHGKGRWMIPLLLIFLPLTTLSLYAMLGEPFAMTKAVQQQQAQQNQSEIAANINKLISHLSQTPDDWNAWLMLGRGYLYLEQYPKAVEVFGKLKQWQPQSVDVLLLYAESVALTQQGQLSGDAVEPIQQAIALEPTNNNALWLAGALALEQGMQDAAIGYWQQLVKQLPADSEAIQKVQQALAMASSTLNPSTPSIAIKLEVSIAAAVLAQAKPDQTVFIYAQALNGPKMPLAIVKKTVKDLPLSIELNDSMAMQPGMSLAQFDAVKLVARLSASGNATPQAGDFIGSTEVQLPVNDQAIHLIIEHLLQ